MDAKAAFKEIAKELTELLPHSGWKPCINGDCIGNDSLQEAVDNGSLIGKPCVVIKQTGAKPLSFHRLIVLITMIELSGYNTDYSDKAVSYLGYAHFTLNGKDEIAHTFPTADMTNWIIVAYERI